jgi:hypothetical protein
MMCAYQVAKKIMFEKALKINDLMKLDKTDVSCAEHT